MAQIKDLLNGFSVVKSFKAEPEAQRQFDVSNQTVEHAKHRRRWSTGQVKTLSGVCGIIMQFGIFIIGAYLAIRGSISGGTMIIFVNLSGCMVNVIYIVPQYWVSRKAAAGLVKKPAQRGSSYRCGENGLGLSGGERQRVFIARCLPRGTPVLLLDEATAALDNQTVFAVTDAILRLDCLTRLVVTHRLDAALMEQYDEIIVLRGGQIQEQGTYAQLMDKKGYFYSLFILAA